MLWTQFTIKRGQTGVTVPVCQGKILKNMIRYFSPKKVGLPEIRDSNNIAQPAQYR